MEKRIQELKYVIGAGNGVPITVSRNVHTAIKRWAKMKNMKINEAVWRLVFMGLKYDIQGPDPRRKELARLSALLREDFMRRHAGFSPEGGIDNQP